MRLAIGVGAGLLVISQTCAAQSTSREAACENYRRQTGKVHPNCASAQAPRPAQRQAPNESTQRPAQASNSQQLAEMPPPDRVLREITHPDPLEAAARRAGAFFQLEAMVEVLSEGRNFRRQLTAEEERIIKSYKQANSAVHKQADSLLPPGNPGEQPSPGVKWQIQVRHYRSSKPYQAELLQKFFSPSWQQNFLAVQTRQEEKVADALQKQRSAEAKAREAPVPSIAQSATVVKGSAARPASEEMVRQVGDFVGGLGEEVRKAQAKECAAKGPPKATGTALRGTYASPWTGTYAKWVAIDFDCGIALYCGAEERFREYSASGNSVTVAGTTYTRAADGALAGPKEVKVTRKQGPRYRTETNNEYLGASKGFGPVQRDVLISPATTVTEACAVGTLRKREP